jgi:hypothetical protein
MLLNWLEAGMSGVNRRVRRNETRIKHEPSSSLQHNPGLA